MSLNKYNATTGELENIASGQRTWVGTRAAYDAAKQAGTLPLNALICITDDEDDTIVDAVIKNDSRAITSNAVANALEGKLNKITKGINNAGSIEIILPYGNLFLVSIAVPTGSSTTVGGLYLVTAATYNSSAPAIVKIVENNRSTITGETGRKLVITTTNQYGVNVCVTNHQF